MAENSTPKKIAANLDESTRSDTPEQLFIVIGGQAVGFNDPVEFDFRVLDKISDPEAFTKHCVADESRSHFRQQKLPVWKFKELSTLYMEHYKVDELLGN